MDDLVLVVSNREFIASRGFSTRIAMPMLEALQQDAWFAAPSAVRDDPLAVVVQLAVFAVRGADVLIDDSGRLLRSGPVPPEAFARTTGLKALRDRAETEAAVLCGSRATAELAGWGHDPALLPRTLLLAYRAVVPPEIVVAGTWLAPSRALDVVRDPVERLVLAVLAGVPGR